MPIWAIGTSSGALRLFAAAGIIDMDESSGVEGIPWCIDAPSGLFTTIARGSWPILINSGSRRGCRSEAASGYEDVEATGEEEDAKSE